jgi:hypothetical protein
MSSPAGGDTAPPLQKINLMTINLANLSQSLNIELIYSRVIAQSMLRAS